MAVPADTTALPALAAGITPCSPPSRGTGAALCLPGPKLHPASSRAKASCSCCAGTGLKRVGCCRAGGVVQGPRGRGPSPERARLSSAETMTSAEASAKGKTFLSCTAGRWTQFTGLEKAPGRQQEEWG